jgi:hypothetical protein
MTTPPLKATPSQRSVSASMLEDLAGDELAATDALDNANVSVCRPHHSARVVDSQPTQPVLLHTVTAFMPTRAVHSSSHSQ